MKRKIGYARVSTIEQDMEGQKKELREAGCKKIYSDKASGAKAERPGLEKCLTALEKEDTLIVTRLDRLGRNMSHLVTLINELKAKGIYFRSLGDGAIDTTTASGELILHIFASLAEFERRVIAERTQIGLKAARARGKKGGRPVVEKDHPTVRSAKRMHEDHSISIPDICETLKISRSTLYRYLNL